MNDLKNSIESVLAEIASQKAAIESEKAHLELLKKELEDEKIKVSQQREGLEKAVKDYGSIEEAHAVVKTYNEKIDEIKHLTAEAKLKRDELIKWENSLYAIETRQSADREELTKRQLELDKREKEYKEVLKAEFLDQLKKQLPS